MGTVRGNSEAGHDFTWVRLSSEAMSTGDFDIATPHAIVIFQHLGADYSEDLPDSVEMTLVLRLPNERGTFSVEESVAGNDILGTHSIDGPIAGRCDEDNCLLSFRRGRGFEGFELRVIDVSSLTTVELFFPFAEEVPDGAELLLAR